jgi:hypothetical protein
MLVNGDFAGSYYLDSCIMSKAASYCFMIFRTYGSIVAVLNNPQLSWKECMSHSIVVVATQAMCSWAIIWTPIQVLAAACSNSRMVIPSQPLFCPFNFRLWWYSSCLLYQGYIILLGNVPSSVDIQQQVSNQAESLCCFFRSIALDCGR